MGNREKIAKVTIEAFKSIYEKEELKIGEGLTCLIGENGSGKSAIIEAISKINESIDKSDVSQNAKGFKIETEAYNGDGKNITIYAYEINNYIDNEENIKIIIDKILKYYNNQYYNTEPRELVINEISVFISEKFRKYTNKNVLINITEIGKEGLNILVNELFFEKDRIINSTCLPLSNQSAGLKFLFSFFYRLFI